MKRPIKPFVVEVKKGAKTKTPRQEPRKIPEAKSTKHELADRKLFSPPAIPTQTTRPTGRILESLDAPAPAPLIKDEPARRRGRPPGSRNKPKLEAGPLIPKKRGRPRKFPEGAVRQVPVTPDLASSLLARMNETPPARPIAPSPPPPSAAKPNRLDQFIASAESGALERVRAGERWKRRLRGAARSAFERRHAKV